MSSFTPNMFDKVLKELYSEYFGIKFEFAPDQVLMKEFKVGDTVRRTMDLGQTNVKKGFVGVVVETGIEYDNVKVRFFNGDIYNVHPDFLEKVEEKKDEV